METTVDALNQPSAKGFFAIVVSGVVDENFIDSIVVREKIFREVTKHKNLD